MRFVNADAVDKPADTTRLPSNFFVRFVFSFSCLHISLQLCLWSQHKCMFKFAAIYPDSSDLHFFPVLSFIITLQAHMVVKCLNYLTYHIFMCEIYIYIYVANVKTTCQLCKFVLEFTHLIFKFVSVPVSTQFSYIYLSSISSS